MRRLIIAVLLMSPVCAGAQQVEPAPENALPTGSVAIPSALLQIALVYMADRPGYAAEISQQIMTAAATKPKTCPMPTKSDTH